MQKRRATLRAWMLARGEGLVDKRTVGVVVGRFQTHQLHGAHKALLDRALSRHERVLVLVGSAQVSGVRRNPLDFVTRAAMLRAHSPRLEVLQIADHPSDKQWSRNLDAMVRLSSPGKRAVLYGGRDSFIPRYHGRFRTQAVALKGFEHCSATSMRSLAASEGASAEAEFRRGAIYACETTFPRLFMCVDVAVLDYGGGSKIEPRLLLGRKHKDDLWCFPGGFVDPTDGSLEQAALRELAEETGQSIEVGNVSMVGSLRVDDRRYPPPDGIMTAVFRAERVFGTAGFAKAGDDLAQVRWFRVGMSKSQRHDLRDQIKPHHQPVFDLLQATGAFIRGNWE